MTFEQIIARNLSHLKMQCASSAFKYKVSYEDVVSESLERVWRYKSRYRIEDGDVGFRKWCSFIVRSVSVDLYRIKKKHQVIDRNFDVSNFNNRHARQNFENVDYLEHVLKYIKKKYKGRKYSHYKIMEMTALGYKIEEIAKELSIAEGSVKSIVHRIRVDINKNMRLK